MQTINLREKMTWSVWADAYHMYNAPQVWKNQEINLHDRKQARIRSLQKLE